MKKCLVLFSGTRSFEKVFESTWDCRGVDIDNNFKPHYNVDILKWDYKTDLKDWIPDYIHSSPVCKNFTPLKNSERKNRRKQEDIDWGTSLVKVTLDIIDWVKTKNPNVKFTIENPRGFMRSLDILNNIHRTTTSYCKYDYPYQKTTDFWFGGFDLKLQTQCSKKDKCNTSINNKGIHPVRIGYRGSYNTKTKQKVYYDDVQMIDSKYFKQLKQQDEYKGFTDTYLRYRIPVDLIKQIYEQVN